MRNLYIILIIIFISNTLLAQPGKVKDTWNELAAKADELFMKGSYYSAVDYYKKAIQLNNKNLELKFKQAEASRMGRDYRGAVSAYRTLMKKGEKDSSIHQDYPMLKYHYATMLKQTEKYELAAEIFNDIYQNYDGDDADNIKSMAQNEYKGCQMAKLQSEKIIVVKEVDNLDNKVNSKYTESSAYVMPDGRLLFTSFKADELIRQEEQKEQGLSSKLYFATIEKFKRSKEVKELSIAYEDVFEHVGSASISEDGERMYLTICQQVGVDTDCGIYLSTKNSGNDKYAWSRPQKIESDINMDGYESTTPWVKSDIYGNDVVYFSSNRPGGQGGYDLYIASGDKLNSIVNLGKTINTIGNEYFPYIDNAEGYQDDRPRLYFSSDGHPSYGGLDVFMSHHESISNTDWSPVKNLGLDVNSSSDETSFVLNGTKDIAYWVSNRSGGYSVAGRTCCDDIFVANIQGPDLEKLLVSTGKVFDENKENLEDITIELYDVTGEGEKELIKTITTASDGYIYDDLDINREYLIEVKEEGYEPYSYTFNTNVNEDKVFEKDIYLIKISDSCTLSFTARNEKGNGALSNAVVKIYQRISGKEELFTTLNTDASGKLTTDLPKGSSFKIAVSKDGFLSSSTSVTTGTSKECTTNSSISLKEKRKDVSFKLDNILYDFNSANLRNESIPQLEILLQLLKDNPSIVIELGSHTDSKGKEAYNMNLSQQRAQSVVDWLVQRGISRNRLVAKGYGESTPLVPNTNPDGTDNPENRQINRRTEFKIIGDIN